ncbi:PspC domain-containing protein [Pseudoduganella sp. GCM10020061]|jgi:phage shock protein C|uniref:PspC domain-containing protein n=1 Tax=Pseudoduganella sp. GCM10020061 TaxID=3317345 RepID=UPI003642CCF2
MSISDEVKRLHELHQAGALSDAEFEQAKARLFASPSPSPGDRTDFTNIRRSRNDRWLGGVCGGLAVSTGLDSWIWRLIFALFTVSFGAGILIYILLWIFIPEE